MPCQEVATHHHFEQEESPGDEERSLYICLPEFLDISKCNFGGQFTVHVLIQDCEKLLFQNEMYMYSTAQR